MDHRPLPIQRDDDGPTPGVVTLRLEQPERKVVVLDRALLARLDATLDEIGDDVAGLVLTSDSRVFVAGADLVEIDGLSDEELDGYLAFGQRVFGRIAALPCTSVAAVHGAALGGGLELAMHCDVLVGLRPGPETRPYQVGLPEASLGICPGWGGTNLLPARIDPAEAIRLTCSGATLSSTDAHEQGLIDNLFDTPEGLLTAAKLRASRAKAWRAGARAPRHIADPERAQAVRAGLASVESDLPATEAARGVVDCIRAGLDGGWVAALEAERRTLVRLRSTDAARGALKAFFERSASR